LFEIISFLAKKYCVVSLIKNKNDNFIWKYVVVYGSSYPELKMEFIVELMM
jgi:hypothetical protein